MSDFLSPRSMLFGAVIGILIVSALPASALAQDEDSVIHKVMLVEGTDPAHEARMRKAFREAPSYEREQAADRALVIAEREAMKKNGYVVTNEEYASVHTITVTSPSIVDQMEVIPLLAFQPAALNLEDQVIGMLYDDSPSGQVHDVTTILRHVELGIITIRERSLATEPRGKSAKYLYGPKFDLEVNGSPALLRAYQTQDGLKGRTSLTVLTTSKLFTVGIGTVLIEGDPNYATLFDIASQL